MSEYNVITTFSRRLHNVKPTFKIFTLEYDVITTFKQRSGNIGYKRCSDVFVNKFVYKLKSQSNYAIYECVTKVMLYSIPQKIYLFNLKIRAIYNNIVNIIILGVVQLIGVFYPTKKNKAYK